ncbi:MAG: hypothetical protein CMO65_06600 [Verrucomicrobiales bacterium]|nr:hypothetical protein [Verrucomicrobiales bacterium]
MKIKTIKVWDSTVRFRHGVYANSKVSRETVHGRIWEFTMTDGRRGYGEVVFPFSWPVDQYQKAIQEEQASLLSLAGKDSGQLMAAARQHRHRGKIGLVHAFALETAWYDLSGKQEGIPICELLGGSKTARVDDYLSISEPTIQDFQDRLEQEKSGPNVVQLKLGMNSRNDDVNQVALALEKLPDIKLLLADANGKWSVDEACEVIAKFDDSRLIWEEPCSRYEANIEVVRLSGKRVMVDQCVGEVSLAMQAVDEGLVSALTIKPAYLGGLTVAREVRDYCADFGVGMRIDGPWCGDIAASAILHLAVGAPPEFVIASCDLREPLEYEGSLAGVMRFDNGQISPPKGPGLGLGNEPLERKMGDPEAIYSI